jgi:hypothetical protein
MGARRAEKGRGRRRKGEDTELGGQRGCGAQRMAIARMGSGGGEQDCGAMRRQRRRGNSGRRWYKHAAEGPCNGREAGREKGEAVHSFPSVSEGASSECLVGSLHRRIRTAEFC